jgi:hypothetical protein
MSKAAAQKVEREQFMQLLSRVPGLCEDDQKKYAKLFVSEKVRGVGQLARMDPASLKAMGIPIGDAVEIIDAVMKLSNSRLIDESSSTFSGSTQDLDEIMLPDLDEGMLYYGFASHNWGSADTGFANHIRTTKLIDKLKSSGVPLWFDHDRLSGTLESQITQGIDHSATFLVFITKDYIEKVMTGSDSEKTDWCHYEFAYAGLQKPNKMIGIVMEPDLIDTKKWKGAVGARLGSKMFVDFSSDDRLESACFDLCRLMTQML